jgi:NAD(P)-dependent dehydrogenase (short-subunit alcohol dehydrogenase family)
MPLVCGGRLDREAASFAVSLREVGITYRQKGRSAVATPFDPFSLAGDAVSLSQCAQKYPSGSSGIAARPPTVAKPKQVFIRASEGRLPVPGVDLGIKGMTAVVTGSSGGIGAAIVAGLANAGANVFGLDVAAPRQERANHVVCDVTDPSAVDGAIRQAVTDTGAIDIVVLAAGRFPNRPLSEWTLEQFEKLWRLNVGGAFTVLQAAIPYLRVSGQGRIVAISSSAIHLAVPGFAPYGATKAALVGLIRGVAAEVADAGVTANIVTPGLTATDAALNGDVAPFFDHVVAGQLIQRRLSPCDLIGAVLFLCSNGAQMLTGQVVNIDGGGVMH